MVPNLTGRDAASGWKHGWDLRVQAPLARFRQSFDGGVPALGIPGLAPPVAAPILLRSGREGPSPGPSLGRIGGLEVRLAHKKSEIRRAQRLRYKVFYEEMSAVPTALARLKRRDIDGYDALCDHLLVVDHDSVKDKPFRKPRSRVVGTYRLLRAERADDGAGFYSAGEFDIAALLARHRGERLLELGRSCVLKSYRTKRTVELLWQGIWAYVRHHRIDALLGCASLEGTDPDRLALPLSFLHHHARAPEAWRARALPERYVPMDRLAREAVDPRAALQALPPLVKGYLRLGATFGDGAVVDRQFGTTDVFVVLPVSAIGARYIGHFGAQGGRHAV